MSDAAVWLKESFQLFEPILGGSMAIEELVG